MRSTELGAIAGTSVTKEHASHTTDCPTQPLRPVHNFGVMRVWAPCTATEPEHVEREAFDRG